MTSIRADRRQRRLASAAILLVLGLQAFAMKAPFFKRILLSAVFVPWSRAFEELRSRVHALRRVAT